MRRLTFPGEQQNAAQSNFTPVYTGSRVNKICTLDFPTCYHILMDNIPFVCKCGSKTFKLDHEAKTLEDVVGAVCEKCGTTLTEDDIRAQALKIAEDLARGAF